MQRLLWITSITLWSHSFLPLYLLFSSSVLVMMLIKYNTLQDRRWHDEHVAFHMLNKGYGKDHCLLFAKLTCNTHNVNGVHKGARVLVLWHLLWTIITHGILNYKLEAVKVASCKISMKWDFLEIITHVILNYRLKTING